MSGTVLILDDDAAVLELTSLYLNSRGFSTLACHSAASALEKLREAAGEIEMLVADVTLPDGSGIEIASQLKDLVPELKILFVSGYSVLDLKPTDSALFHRLPPNSVSFLRKPYSGQDLVDKLTELSGRP
jgi:CheY-like chemotaxis protein